MQPPWWSKYDGPILQLLADTDAALPPRVIQFNLEYRNIASPHRSTVKRRLQRLEENDFVDKVNEAGYYVISKNGEEFLRENLE